MCVCVARIRLLREGKKSSQMVSYGTSSAPFCARERERKESDAAFCRPDKLRVSEINAFGRAAVEIRFKNSTSCGVKK
jgi:hypothetical protein